MVRCKDTGRGRRAQDEFAGDKAVSSRVVGGGGGREGDRPETGSPFFLPLCCTIHIEQYLLSTNYIPRTLLQADKSQ